MNTTSWQHVNGDLPVQRHYPYWRLALTEDFVVLVNPPNPSRRVSPETFHCWLVQEGTRKWTILDRRLEDGSLPVEEVLKCAEQRARSAVRMGRMQ